MEEHRRPAGAPPAGSRHGAAPNGYAPSSTPGQAATTTPDASEPRQRWRLVIRRGADADPLVQAEWQAAWETALARSGLPIAWTTTKRPRPRFVPALPIPAGLVAEGELADLFLTRPRTRWQLREALEPVVPQGHELRDCYDVWLGSPSLPGRVAAAGYLARLPVDASARERVASAVDEIVAMERIERRRERGERVVTYDLRPQILGLAVVGDPGGGPASDEGLGLEMLLRHDPGKGPGRPDEVLREVGERIGEDLRSAAIVRTRVVLAEDLERDSESRHPHRAPEIEDPDP
jgi:radical SAM-linked protein